MATATIPPEFNPNNGARIVVTTEGQLAALIGQLLPGMIYQGLREFKAEELQEKFLSPEEACKLFSPAISLPTLESYHKKYGFQKHRFGGRVWYRQGELLEALTKIKRFAR